MDTLAWLIDYYLTKVIRDIGCLFELVTIFTTIQTNSDRYRFRSPFNVLSLANY